MLEKEITMSIITQDDSKEEGDFQMENIVSNDN